MPSSYSPDLRLELPADGEQTGLWGQTTNRNLGTLIGSAISGVATVSVTTADQALMALNGADDQSRHAVLSLSTTTEAAFAVYAPPASKTYIVRNTSAHTATIYNSTVLGGTTAAGSGVAVPAGKSMTVVSDGANFTLQNTATPTQTYGSNDTSFASTAFVQAALQALHPVGSVYINASNATNPGTLLGFGTWAAFGAGRVPVGFNAADPLFDTAEETGGSKDAIVVSHTHTASTGNQSANHTHTFNGTTGDTGSTHTHGGFSQFGFDVNGSGSSGTARADFGDNTPFSGVTTEMTQGSAHTHNFSGTTVGVSADHNHAVTVESAGAPGTNANLQPYITVFMWKRTA